MTRAGRVLVGCRQGRTTGDAGTKVPEPRRITPSSQVDPATLAAGWLRSDKGAWSVAGALTTGGRRGTSLITMPHRNATLGRDPRLTPEAEGSCACPRARRPAPPTR